VEGFEHRGWLLTNGDDSICITQNRDDGVFVVCGPGFAVCTHQFMSSAALEDFCAWYVGYLQGTGWLVHPFADRRYHSEPSVPRERRAHAGEMTN
jgi:hypothetical protein